MRHLGSRRVGCFLWAFALAAVIAAGGAACGRGTVSTSNSVQVFNDMARVRNVELRCPEDVDEEMEQIDCTLQGTKTGKTAAVKIRAIDNEDDFIDAVDGAEFTNAVERVTQP